MTAEQAPSIDPLSLPPLRRHADNPLHVFLVFLRLGLTSFGGPIAHLGYFRTEFVERRRWLDEAAYARLVALCQLLPGPASSQVGIALGLMRCGYPGAVAAWLGFTAPSAIVLILFGMLVAKSGWVLHLEWLHGLLVAAVAVVAQALWAMGRSLCPDARRATVAVAGACAALAMPGVVGQILVIAGGAIAGILIAGPAMPLVDRRVSGSNPTAATGMSRRSGLLLLTLLAALLAGLPVLAQVTAWYPIALFDEFFRTGSLVFGGGHVVLPLLQASVVPRGWLSNELFLAGYGLTQAVPGPLFTFAAYLGSASSQTPNGWIGGIVAVFAIFLPSFLVVCGALPFVEVWNSHPKAGKALAGINAAVVGLLLAAFYNPIWTSAIASAFDFGLAAAAFVLLVFWKCPPWLVVMLAALASALFRLAGFH
ncbi:MAG: chr [Herminiimonas sp.]|nr:chr [Herminiimonas sp.]MDB5853612.1 chr [Herminiimonas sp.]